MESTRTFGVRVCPNTFWVWKGDRIRRQPCRRTTVSNFALGSRNNKQIFVLGSFLHGPVLHNRISLSIPSSHGGFHAESTSALGGIAIAGRSTTKLDCSISSFRFLGLLLWFVLGPGASGSPPEARLTFCSGGFRPQGRLPRLISAGFEPCFRRSGIRGIFLWAMCPVGALP